MQSLTRLNALNVVNAIYLGVYCGRCTRPKSVRVVFIANLNCHSPLHQPNGTPVFGLCDSTFTQHTIY